MSSCQGATPPELQPLFSKESIFEVFQRKVGKIIITSLLGLEPSTLWNVVRWNATWASQSVKKTNYFFFTPMPILVQSKFFFFHHEAHFNFNSGCVPASCNWISKIWMMWRVSALKAPSGECRPGCVRFFLSSENWDHAFWLRISSGKLYSPNLYCMQTVWWKQGGESERPKDAVITHHC